MTNAMLTGPLLAQVGLTLVVLLWLYAKRIPGMRKYKVHPEATKKADWADAMPREIQFPADNFKNLFELPVAFFALALTAQAAGLVDDMTVMLAWGFVGLRAIHSIIQCTYNRVMHRFLVFFTGSIVLMVMFVRVMLAYAAQ